MTERAPRIDATRVSMRLTDAAAILPLRRDVLRPGRPLSEARFAGDDEATTFHLGAFDGATPVACATLVHRPWATQPAYQLRGMATRPDLSARGFGRAVLRLAEETVAERTTVRLLWANAREEAVGFYVRHGWQVASDRFEILSVGPHYRIIRRLDESQPGNEPRP